MILKEEKRYYSLCYLYNKYKKYSDNAGELKSLGNSVALCMGDYGLYLASNIIIKAYSNDKNLSKLFTYFNDNRLKNN